MVTIQHTCAKCGSEQIWHYRRSAGHARYQCEARGQQARFVQAAGRIVRYAQLKTLLAARNSQPSLVRVTGAARMIVAEVAKKARVAIPCCRACDRKSATHVVEEALTGQILDVFRT